ncbi:MAG: DUF1700 domain-containing protein [Ruminococcaceae bacterium]|nr:DUF1700 domain-containing protein [Oscillospiraceae bacterium]
MTKIKFLLELHEKLSGLPQDEVEERLNFYSEMIEDRIEEGLSEEEAVSAVGSVDEIAAQITADIPLVKIAKEKIKPKRQLKAWEIVLLVLGSPIWFSLLVAVFSVILSLYVSLWAVIISLWAVFVSVIACAFGVIVSGIGFAIIDKVLTGIAMIGAGIVCIGLSIFLFFGCKAVTNGTLLLTKKTAQGIKKLFIKKEEA